MAKYRVTGPGGATYEVTAPDNASPDDVMGFVQAQHEQQHAQIAGQIANDPISQGARDFNSGASTLDNLRAGAGKALTDIARGAGQLAGAVSYQDVADSRRMDKPLMATTAGKVGDIAGNVIATAPAAILAGPTLAGGLAAGAVTGAMQPGTSLREKLLNTGIGAAAGAVVPLATRAIQTAKAAAEPLYDAGKEAIIGRTLNAAAGKDAPQVAKRLADAAKPFVGPNQGAPRTIMGEYVPGSIPTVGQAAENAGVASLESAATATNPAVTNAVADTVKAQNAARVGVLTDMSGTQGARDFFDANRKVAAQQLYQKAYAAGLPKLTAAEEGLVADLMQRPAIKSAVGEAKTLAANEGSNITDAAGSVQGLDYVKRALDDQIAKATAGSNEQRILTGLQKKLTGFLDSVSPDYAAARTTFQQMSKPINQMDVAQAIADKSVDKLSGNLKPSAFARALSDDTAKQATGFGKATLEGTMDGPQLNALNSILLDVQRSTGAQNAGRGIGSDTVRKLAYTNLMDQSGLPTFIRDLKPLQIAGNVASRGADALYGRANKEISNRLAEVMLDPGMAAELMKRATPVQRSQLMQIAARAGSGLSLAAPASANALEH
jgi:hypothetical protein